MLKVKSVGVKPEFPLSPTNNKGQKTNQILSKTKVRLFTGLTLKQIL